MDSIKWFDTILQCFTIILIMLLNTTSCGTNLDAHNLFSSTSEEIIFDLIDPNGKLIVKQKIKPLNGVGNGPLYRYQNNRHTINWSAEFKELHIPIIRYHDVEYINKNNQAINISAIFPNSNADESKTSSYNFSATDQLMKAATETGARIIFRLGENIQNLNSATGDNTPPKDFHKWARIAERIVAHYEDGWNNGFRYTNIMWEVWNEPDNHQCWNGSFDDYCEFYKTVWRCIHAKHPDADISPAYAYSAENRAKLYRCIKENGLGIRHCFVHHYWEDFSGIGEDAKKLKDELEQQGLEADIIMDEWNYLSPDGGWNNLVTTFYAIQSQQAAAWYAKQLIHMQAAKDLAGAVYYVSDMPGFWTGLYKRNSKGELVVLPAYDTFRYFGKLYNLGYEVKPDKVPEGIYVLAATDGKKEVGVMVVNDSEESKEVDVRIKDVRLDECKIQVKSKKVQAADEKIRLRLLPYEVSFVNILTQ